MSQYKKGIQTKENILSSANDLFYEYGFKDVSVQKICKQSHVKLGTFTYYFNKKDDLIIYLYNHYMDRINDYIDHHTMDLSPAQKHIHMILMYYYNIYHHDPIVRFHEQVLQRTSMYNVLYKQTELIHPFTIHSKLAQDENMLDLLILADNAVRRELNLISITQQSFSLEDIKSLVTKIYTVTAQLFSYDQTLLLAYIDEGYTFLLQHLHHPIYLLEPPSKQDGL